MLHLYSQTIPSETLHQLNVVLRSLLVKGKLTHSLDFYWKRKIKLYFAVHCDGQITLEKDLYVYVFSFPAEKEKLAKQFWKSLWQKFFFWKDDINMFLKSKLRKKKEKKQSIPQQVAKQNQPKNDKHNWSFYLALRSDLWVFCTCVPSKESLYKGKLWNLHFTFI